MAENNNINLWQRLSRIGVTNSIDDKTSKKIILSNQISIVMIILVSVSAIIFAYENSHSPLTYFIFGINIVPIFTLLLNVFKQTKAGRFTLGAFTPFIILINIIMLKYYGSPSTFNLSEFQFYTPRYYLVVVSLIPLFVLDFRERKLLYIALFANILWLLFFDVAHDIFGVGIVDFGYEPRSFYQTALMPVILLIFLYSGLMFFQKETDTYEQKIETLLANEQQYTKRIEKEISLGRKVIQRLLPVEMDNKKEIQAAAILKWCSEVGGDYYTFKEINKNKHLIIVADVSGKGLPASIVVSTIHSCVETQLNTMEFSLSSFIHTLNEVLYKVTDDMMYATLWAGLYDSKNNTLESATCGHPYPIFYNKESKTIQNLDVGSTILGYFIDDFKLETQTIQLSKDDIILIYTDGLSECKNSEGVMLQDTNFIEMSVETSNNLQPAEIIKNIYDKLMINNPSEELEDDLTMLCMKFVKE